MTSDILANCGDRVRGDTGLAPEKYAPTQEQILKGFKMVCSTTAAAAAGQIISGVRWNSTRIMVGNDAVILDWFIRLFPHLLYTWPMIGWTIVSTVLIAVRVVSWKMIVALVVCAVAVVSSVCTSGACATAGDDMVGVGACRCPFDQITVNAFRRLIGLG